MLPAKLHGKFNIKRTNIYHMRDFEIMSFNEVLKNIEISEKEAEAYFGKNAVNWLPRWKIYKDKRTPFLGFNAGILLFLIVWYFYRKMPFVFIGLVIINSVIDSFVQKLLLPIFGIHLSDITFTLISFPLSLFLFGFFSNFIYIWNANRKIINIKRKHSDEHVAIEVIKKKGGVSYLSASIGLILMFLFLVLILWANQQYVQ